MSATELRLHAVVSELLAYLGVREEPEALIGLLARQGRPAGGSGGCGAAAAASPASTFPLAEQIALRAAALSHAAPERFLGIYERLRAVGVRELDPLLYILDKVQEDAAVAAALGAGTAASQVSHTLSSQVSHTSVSAVPARLRSTVSAGSLRDLAQSPRTKDASSSSSSAAAAASSATPRSALAQMMLAQRSAAATAPSSAARSRRLAQSRSAASIAALALATNTAAAPDSVTDGPTLASMMTPAARRSATASSSLASAAGSLNTPAAKKSSLWPQLPSELQQPHVARLRPPLERVHNPPPDPPSTLASSAPLLLLDRPSLEQEALIIEDLLYVLMGINGEFIHRIPPSDSAPEVPSFSIDGNLEASLAEMISKIIPLAGHYILVDTFVDERSSFAYGRVSHALCAAIRSLLHEYLVLVGQLEHLAHTGPRFTLQKMWYYISPSLQVMGALASLVAAVYDADTHSGSAPDAYDVRHVLGDAAAPPTRISGGRLLNILTDRMISLAGNADIKRLYSFLLGRASAPYLATLSTWISSGELDDPFGEFLVEEHTHLNKEKLRDDFNDVYWEQRYTIRDDAMPVFLEPWREKILHAGKYLNVLRECGIEVPKPDARADGLNGGTLTAGAAAMAVTVAATTPMDKTSPGAGADFEVTAATAAFAATNVSGAVPNGANVLRIADLQTDVAAAIDGGRFVLDIERAYLFANSALIGLLVRDHRLFDRIKSLKRFFLLEQSDYLTHFLDLAADDLMRPVSEVPLEKVRSLLELVIRSPSSCTSSDPFKDDVTVELSSLSLFQQLLKINSMVGLDVRRHMENLRSGRSFNIAQSLASGSVTDGAAMAAMSIGGLSGDSGPLTGIEAFELGYSVSFPLSLVINKKTLTKYQMVFRQLFLCKYLERLLSNTWLAQTKLRKRYDAQIRRYDSKHGSRNDTATAIPETKEALLSDMALLVRMSLLREKMLHFIKMFMYYVFFEVLEPNWCVAERLLRSSTTVDDILRAHDDFLNSCLKECMLTSPKLMKIFGGLVATCHGFVQFCDEYARHKTMETHGAKTLRSSLTPSSLPQDHDPHVSDHASFTSFEQRFTRQINRLIDALQVLGVTETPRLGHLLSQIDYNSYYRFSMPSNLFGGDE